MTRIIIAILAFMLSAACAQAIDYKKFLETHDVDASTIKLKSDNPADFWLSLVDNNESLQEFYAELDKGKGKEAKKKIAGYPRFNPKYRPDVLSDLDGLCDSITNSVGKIKNLEVCIIDDDEINASSMLSDDGMVVGVNSGFLSAKGMTKEILYGIVAHEYAHSLLSHIMQTEYAYTKRKRRNKILEAMTIGMTAVAAGADAYTSGMLGTEAHTRDYVSDIVAVKRESLIDLFMHHYSYLREHEFEADLIAYRFLEWSGYGGDSYIEALKILEANSDLAAVKLAADKDDDHPTIRERIEFLRFVKNHPEIGNTQNSKIKKSKKLKERLGSDDIYD